MSDQPLATSITFPVPFAVGSMNLYLFRADPPTLLDTGPKTEHAREAIRRALAAERLSVKDINRIVITHGHVDHFGLARELAEESGAKIYIHPYDVCKTERGYDFMAEKLPLLKEAGVPENQLRELAAWSRRTEALLDPLEEVHPLRENDLVAFDSFALEVLHCPGHSQGHICLYHRERGELFCGDHLLKHISPNPAVEPAPDAPERRSRSLVQYLDSLKKIERLNLKRALPAHGPAVESPQKRIAEIGRHHQRRKDRLLQLLDGQGSTAYELGKKLFGASKEMDVYLVVSEVLGHLDLLLGERHASAENRDGVIYYSAAA
jgi:glyoxylase-like metal-dependent hydrolase (beta-lactamase superfamily II)